jgi:hypothetical protein
MDSIPSSDRVVQPDVDVSPDKVNHVTTILDEINPSPKKKEDAEEEVKVEPFETIPFSPYECKTMDDYIFQFFLGTISVTGLFILFRMIQRSK